MRASDLLMRCLENEGIEYIFGVPGEENAEYAGPPPQLPIQSVRQRLFRGFCRPDTDWETLFKHFESRRNAVRALLDQISDMRASHRKRAGRYLEVFFSVLESPKRRQEQSVGACRSVAVD